jgi:hypothetical protein
VFYDFDVLVDIFFAVGFLQLFQQDGDFHVVGSFECEELDAKLATRLQG